MSEKPISNLDKIAERLRQRIQALKKKSYPTKQLSFADIQKKAVDLKQPQQKSGGNNVLPQITSGLRLGRPKSTSINEAKIPEKVVQKLSTPSPEKFVSPPKVKTFKPDNFSVFDFKREPYVVPSYKDITPSWFPTKKVDISIIVPMYNSSKEIEDQINSWDLKDNTEIIYVSDACPQGSENKVLSLWTPQKHPNGKIIVLSNNAGFSTACNIGASLSNGEKLIFLNADTIVTPNWIEPLSEIFENYTDVGIVGNLQLKQDGSIDSAGSEWMWDNRTFEHIGRNVYQGERLSSTIKIDEAPEDLKEVAERDMVTGCCFMIKKDLFNEVGGFDVGYRIGYWEDSDLNMKVKSHGYKVYYQPKSVIYHKCGHSRAGLHPFVMDNFKRFNDTWVNNKRIDDLVKAKRP